jgi:hypothetical protein
MDNNAKHRTAEDARICRDPALWTVADQLADDWRASPDGGQTWWGVVPCRECLARGSGFDWPAPDLSGRAGLAVLDALLKAPVGGVLETVSKIFSRISPESPENGIRASVFPRTLALAWCFSVGVAGFEPAASSSRTKHWALMTTFDCVSDLHG